MQSPPPETIAPTLTADLDRVTVILASYHSGHCAPELGRGLAAFPHIIVVDNASTDDTLAQFQHHLPHAKILVNAANLGFGAANNRGISNATTEFVLLLNPDCVIEPQAVQALIRTMAQYPTAAASGPQLLDRHGKLDLSYCVQANGWPGQGPAAQGETCVGFLSGACLLIRRDAMAQVNGFDEDFFLYQEDTDLCIRLSQLVGELIVTPQARVTHYARGSSGGRARLKAEYIRGYHHIQSKYIFQLKHLHLKVSIGTRVRYCVIAALELAVRLALLDFVRAARVWGRLRGTWAYRSPTLAPQSGQS